jgi:energy-coupling factor transporter ATP-binding protein EcfA2
MINNIQLKFGKAPGLPPEVIQSTPVTVFVGPNNSGKSKILSEIHRYCSSGQENITDVIISRIDFLTMTPERAQEKVIHFNLPPVHGETIHPNHIIFGKRGTRHHVPSDRVINFLTNPSVDLPGFCQIYLNMNTLILNGQNRINLINSQGAGDFQQPPHSSFQVLFRDDAKRSEVRRIIHDAFGSHFVIDPTNLGNLRIRLSSRAPATPFEERGIHEEAVLFHSNALPIEQASDGVKAFTGMITEIIAGDPEILLIDEPEAFLHPSLSFKLGKEIALATTGSQKRVLVSTHSPNFVMGCIQSGAPVTIVRLTYRGGVATARILPNTEILKLMRNPLLRSTGVLGGLFYEFVVVTESDADRAFYQEVNERLLRFNLPGGIPNCLFINAQNKQTVQTILKPLRELGIPAAGIVDIDVLKEGGTVWMSFLEGGFVPELERHSMATLRTGLKQKFDQSGRDMKRDGGVSLLQQGDQETAQNLLDRLAEYGLFVVPHGELESWLPQLGATGHGPGWLVNVFEQMGEDPDSGAYMQPSDDDVWAFIGRVKAWLVEPRRKGIPA